MNIKKLTAAFMVLALSVTALSGCAAKEEKKAETKVKTTKEEKADPVTIRVGALKGPTAMGMAQMLQNKDTKSALNNYEFTISASPDEIVPSIVQGNLDIASVPANLSSVLYAKTNKEVSVLAINTLGILYMVETGDTVHSVADLKGKTIYASGKGATPEYALNSVLTANNINPETDVTIEYKSEHAEIVASLAQNPEAIGLLPQPFVTSALMQNESMRVALDLNQEWQTSQGDESGLVTGVVIVRNSFLKEHEDAVKQFLSDYNKSIKFVNDNPTDASKIIEENNIIPAKVAEKAIPECNITYIDGNEMKDMLSAYLNTLMTQNPETVGGQLPDDNFYYTK